MRKTDHPKPVEKDTQFKNPPEPVTKPAGNKSYQEVLKIVKRVEKKLERLEDGLWSRLMVLK